MTFPENLRPDRPTDSYRLVPTLLTQHPLGGPVIDDPTDGQRSPFRGGVTGNKAPIRRLAFS